MLHIGYRKVFEVDLYGNFLGKTKVQKDNDFRHESSKPLKNNITIRFN